LITIVAVGKKHEGWITDGLERYEKRLVKPWDARWVLLPHSPTEGAGARQDESERILQRLNPNDFVVLLDERGKLLDSPALAKQMEAVFPTGKNIVCIIGGAYGVNDALTARANLVWSLSPLVFPHQLVRLILIEQIYRAQKIALGHPYHHV
jgi:23S rRNA (pseudouridine1915-N3)-methyltransferase